MKNYTGDLFEEENVEATFPVLATGGRAANDHSHKVRRHMGIIVERLKLGKYIVEQNYVVADGRKNYDHGSKLDFVLKKYLNKKFNIIIASILNITIFNIRILRLLRL